MSAKIVIASKNPDKIREILDIFGGGVPEFIICPDLPDVIEDGSTFYENALKKARSVSEYTGLPALSDDSGLEVDALDGAPGVRSARYSGPEADYASNNRKLLRELEGVTRENRTARFRTCAVVFFPDGRIISAEGICEGLILESPAGINGFGYDPLFLVISRNMTMAEMDEREKNLISHRGMALKKIKNLIKDSR